MSKKCSTPSCECEAIAAGLCRNCYDYIYRATRRGVKWMMARRTRIQVWSKRLDSASSAHKVIHIRRRKAA